MLGKLSCLLVLCSVIAGFTHGGVLRTVDNDDTCSKMFVNCTTNEECCNFMRCLDLGNGYQCSYGTDNPQLPDEKGDAIQPPRDLMNKLGCSLLSQTCETRLDCCKPYVCTSDRTCQDPYEDPYGLGGYGGYGGFPGK